MRVYRDSVVSFVDMLGFTNALDSEENAEEILMLLNDIKNNQRKSCLVTATATNHIVDIKVQPTISAFSDNVVISVPQNALVAPVSWRHAIFEILNITAQLASLVIQKGFLLRGGLSFGKLYHEDGVVFGPALAHSYQIEKNLAIFPRILADATLVQRFNEDNTCGVYECFILDVDGNYFLDYLKFSSVFLGNPNIYTNIVNKKILFLKSQKNIDDKVLDKWIWFEKYCQNTISRLDLKIYEKMI